MYDLNFDSARSVIQGLSQNDPQKIYIEHLMDAVGVFIYESDDAYDNFKNKTDDRIKSLQPSISESPYPGYFMSEIRLHESILDLKFEKQFSAAINFNKAHRNIERNMELYPDFELNNKVSGIIDVAAGAVPENYAWLMRLFGYKGNIEEGLNKIRNSGINEITEMEADILEKAINIFLLGKPISDNMRANETQSPVTFQYSMAFLQNKSSNGRTSLIMTEELLAKNPNLEKRLPQIYYLLGKNYIQAGYYQKAIESFSIFIKAFKGNNQVKDALYKTALAYQFKGDENQALQVLEKVKINGVSFTESDRYAEKVSQTGILPPAPIGMLRQFYDGGYVDQAELLIRSTNQEQFNAKEQMEWKYRQARLYHLEEKYDQCIRLYQEVILLDTEKRRSYFAPNSCLQLGYLFKKLKNLQKSKEYFEQVFEYRDYSYESSIRNKAKTALKQLK